MAFGVVTISGTDDYGPWTQQVAEIQNRIEDVEGLLNYIADRAVLPVLAQNYANSGLKTGRGVVKQALSVRGAAGNVIMVNGNRLTVTFDFSIVPELAYQIGGRDTDIVPVNKKALAIPIGGGKVILRKRAKGYPPNNLYAWTSDDVDRCQNAANEYVAARSGDYSI